MNRELKFRLWNGVEWLGVDEFTLWDLKHPHKGHTFQQFTGMLDKNGKEIYEGDLIECPQYVKGESFSNPLIVTGEVKWDEKEGCWSAYPACSETNYNLYKANSEKIEIVGNIFEQ